MFSANPTWLRLLGAVAFGAGVLILLKGLRLLRVRAAITQLKPDAQVPPPKSGNSQASPPKVIRLSPDSRPATSIEMTQQQRIAAALHRAGVATPTFVAESEAPHAQTATGLLDNPSSTTEDDSISLMRQSRSPIAWLSAGALLVLASLILLLRSFTA